LPLLWPRERTIFWSLGFFLSYSFSLNFINALFSRFSRKLNEFNSTVSSRSTIDSKKIYQSFYFNVPFWWNFSCISIVGNRDNYIITLLKVSRNFSLILYLSLVARLNYYLISIVKYQSQPRSVDVVPIGHRHNINRIIPNTRSSNLQSINPSTNYSNNDELRESLVDTTLFYFKDVKLLCFIILLFLGRVNTPPTKH